MRLGSGTVVQWFEQKIIQEASDQSELMPACISSTNTNAE
jgi:hypothetical protein